MKELVYNQKGEKVEDIELSSDVFGLPLNRDLLHQAVVTQQANKRKVVAHTKDRSEVRGGGKKPWRQKGTGQARHGSIRSPLWRGGGITFGPTNERVFEKKINKKMKQKALLVALSSKLRDNELIILDKIEIEQAKTKYFVGIIKDLSQKLEKELHKGFVLVLDSNRPEITRAVRNIAKAGFEKADQLNVLEVMNTRYLIIVKDAIKVLEDKFGKKSSVKKPRKTKTKKI